jgi:glycosyltransferase involved in cell wall biosynthesis
MLSPELPEVEPVVWTEPIAVSVVLPCLNEEASVAQCISSASKVLSTLGEPHEIIVVDNGSTDGSLLSAVAAGASVVTQPRRGYGNACRAGLSVARGRVAVLADADGTYDLAAIPALVGMVREGVHLAMGSRLRGQMEPGAMPWLHRLGTPVLTGLINRFFGTTLTDVNCGMRAINMTAYRNLGLRSEGMEFASEMVVTSALDGLAIAEVPVGYKRRRAGEPKLKTWRDGRRHLRVVMNARRGRRNARNRVSAEVSGLGRSQPDEPGGPAETRGSDADSVRI